MSAAETVGLKTPDFLLLARTVRFEVMSCGERFTVSGVIIGSLCMYRVLNIVGRN